MNSLKVPVQTLVKNLNFGTLSLGKCRMEAGEPAGLTRMFTLKKSGMEYVGQVRVRSGNPTVQIEVFNENYFNEFDQPKSSVLENLAQKVLKFVAKDKELPETLIALIREYFAERKSSEKENAEVRTKEIVGNRDLDKILS